MGEKFDLKLPDGTILSGIPEGTTKDQIAAKLRAAGMAVPQENTWGQAIKNVGDAGASLVTGIVGNAAGNVAGLGAIAVDQVGRLFGNDPGETADPEKVKSAVSGALTYEPYNPGSLSSKIVQAPGKAISATMNAAADIPGIKGTPYLDTFVRESLAPAALEGLGLKMAKAARAKAAEETVPTTPELHDAAREAYKNAEGSGATVAADDVSAALDKVRDNAVKLGLDKDLTPKSMRVLERLEESRGKPLDFMEADKLRRVANGVADEVHPGTGKPTHDATIARQVVDDLDDAFESLPGGSEARTAWSRYRRSDMVDEMTRKAEIRAGANYTQSGLENALRAEFKSLAMNAKKMKRLTTEQRAAVTKVAKGGALENTLRNLGKLSPENGGLTGVITGGAGIAGAMAGHPGALAAIPVGFAAKRAATAMTKGNVAKARAALVGRGIPGKAAPKVGTNVGSGRIAAGIAAQASHDDPYTQKILELLRGE